MLNHTNQIVMLCDGAELDERIRTAIGRLKPLLYAKYGAGYDKGRFSLSSPLKHGRNLAEVLDRLIPMDGTQQLLGHEFVNALMTSANTNAQREGFNKTFGALARFFPGFASLNSSLGIRLKGILKLLLVAVWAEKAILLPFSFTLGGGALVEHASIIDGLVPEIFQFFRRYKDGGSARPEGAQSLSKDSPVTLYKYAPRVILASTYSAAADVDLSELAEFLVAMRKQGNATHLPVLLMATELLTFYPDQARYSKRDLESLSIWTNSPVYQRSVDIRAFMRDRERAERMRAPATSPAKRDRSARTLGASSRAGMLSVAATIEGHEALVSYYKSLQGVRRDGLQWLTGHAPYPGREHVELGALSGRWVDAFSTYMTYRKVVQDFDSTEGIYRAFNYLCDYLFLYLPWWRELNPDAGINVPLAPNELKRGIFIQRTELSAKGKPAGVDKLPMTFPDLLAVRQHSADARYGTLNNLIQFLEWVEVAFEDDERIGGRGYRSPLKRIDLPRVKRRTKTNKVPFSRKVYPHLLFYAYALEAFGQYLQQVAIGNPPWFGPRVRKEQKFLATSAGEAGERWASTFSHAAEQEIYPENFGYVPFICYRGKNYPITRVPNVYQWAERTIDGSRLGGQPETVKCWMPHLGTLRMLIAAIETGLRLQSLQWLDARTWDSANAKSGVPQSLEFNLTQYGLGGFALPLVVAVDKTKDDTWVTQIVFRLRNCLAREQNFRNAIAEPDMDLAVDYEGIADSRFGKILPLFRATKSPAPPNDKTYSNYWAALLWGFEQFYNTQVSRDGFTQFVYMTKTEMEPVPDYENVDFFDLRAIHTPHSCRATYATNRTGWLETSDVAMQLGHNSSVVTAHYTVSTPEIMAEKLAYADRMLLADVNVGVVRADKPESALRQGFQLDRDTTIREFMFAPAVAIWSIDDLSKANVGLEALRNSPMSQIVFRETHICPVGEVCPSEVVEKLGATKRCGMCPLAMKCVDHLPAIAAKINQLKMTVRVDIRRAEALDARGEPEAIVDALYEAAESDANEIVGWQLSHDILLQMRRRQPASTTYHVQAPEVVQKHLDLVTTNRNLSEFLLQRIVDADAYPSLADPEIQRIADRFHRHLMGAPAPDATDDSVASLAGLIKTQLAPRGLTLTDLADHIDRAEQYAATLPVLFEKTLVQLEQTKVEC
ncbi:hypothetical protein [Burkholderia ubonensis]|uniref:hypothetical protein n=1 Tax=Burkholderia ubonensis TaxID=101571 RepID=UPI0012F8FDC7|nr:hypothetical protein [Burkholderia ubonensis]